MKGSCDQICSVFQPFLDTLILERAILLKETPTQPAQHSRRDNGDCQEEHQEMTRWTKPFTKLHTVAPMAVSTDSSLKCQQRIMVLSGLCQEVPLNAKTCSADMRFLLVCGLRTDGKE